MARCTVCGNDDDRAFDVRMPDGTSGTYDSIECAAHDMAPRCAEMTLTHAAAPNGHAPAGRSWW